jgi:alpha-methylacyl-CoA racemase
MLDLVNLSSESNLMNRGKKLIRLSPKIEKDKEIIEELIRISDVIIDPYRPGVLERLGVGPSLIYTHNPKAVLMRVSGYGQSGSMSQRPGHDINYIGYSGILPIINRKMKGKLLQFPVNFLADFVGCSLALTATLAALTISQKTGVGRIVDCSLADSVGYLAQIVMEGR